MHFKGLTIAALAGTALGQGLVSTLSGAPQLSILTSYLSLFPDLVNQLSSLSNITLLAPNNAAFAALLNSSAGAAITNNQTELIQALFTYHVLNGSYPSINETAFIPTALQPTQYTNVTGGQRVEAVPGDNGAVTFFSGLLQNSSVTGKILNFTGGVIHIIDTVLTIPQNISETAIQLNLSSAVGALTAANLAETVDYLSDVTVFVPNNEAFQAIGSALPNLTTQQVTDILEYHVINGTVGYSTGLMNGTSLQTVQGNNVTIRIEDDQVYVNGARVVVPNVLVANGVVHVIDNVLNPNNATATASSGSSGGAGSPAFSGASSATAAPYTSGVATPTATLATSAVASSQSAAATSSSSSAAAPMKTGAVGAAALFGGAALVINMQ